LDEGTSAPIVACGVTSASCNALAKYPTDLVGWVEQSSVIFHGTVTALHADSPEAQVGAGTVGPGGTPLFPQDDPSRQVFLRPDKFWTRNPNDPYASSYAGYVALNRDNFMLVQLPSVPTFSVGYVGYFFVNAWYFGNQTVGMLAVAQTDSSQSKLDSEIPDIQKRLLEQHLFDLLSQASAVVKGKVTATMPFGPIGLETPNWVEATVNVECVLHGASAMTVPVRFASNWKSAPQLKVGDEAIYALSVDTVTTKASTPGYVVLDPVSVHPLTDMQTLVDLLACPSPAP
jgi:hypothetical protein